MYTFEISSEKGDLGPKAVTPSNVEKHRADFCSYLDRGIILSSVTVTVTSGTSTVSDAAMSADRKAAVWLFHAAIIADDATIALTVTTNDGQTLVYTVRYKVG